MYIGHQKWAQMKNILWVLLVLKVLVSCKATVDTAENSKTTRVQNVVIDTLFQDEISIRAIQIDKNNIWYAADKGRFGTYNLVTNQRIETKIKKDSLTIEFRSIAQTTNHIFILNVGSPAVLYKILKDDKDAQIVYQENHEKVFYDSMQFWDDTQGIAMGDPIADCLNIIITRDAGQSWNKVGCDKLPKVMEGEAAFAASNTNIVVKGNNTWIVSGGKKSQVYYSPDKGKNWAVFETPIIQGKAMTGIFSADFYNEKIGFVVGGDYENQNQNFSNKAFTVDGGKTWKLVAENEAFGYASCVQFVPESNGKKLMTAGPSGVYYSVNFGISWQQIALDNSLHTIRFIDKKTAVAAGKNKMIRILFK